MVKKILGLLLVLTLTACSSGDSQMTAAEAKSESEVIAAQIMNELSLTSSMEQVKDRIVKGLIFEGQDVNAEGTLYFSTDKDSADAVGVFVSDDIESIVEYLESYVEDARETNRSSNPTQVFKLANAVIAYDDDTAVLIVCDEIEKARKCAENLLGGE